MIRSRPLTGTTVTDVTKSVYRCHFDRPELARIARAARRDWQPTGTMFGTVRHNTRFECGSLHELLLSVARCAEPGDPDILENLTITMMAARRSVQIDIGKRGATIRVAADDSAWAQGKAEQLRSLMRSLGSTDNSMRFGRAPSAALGAVAACGGVASMCLMLGVRLAWLTAGVALLAVGTLAIAGYIVGHRRERAAMSHLYIAGPVLRTRPWRRMTLVDKASLCAFIAACVSALALALGLVLKIWLGY